MPYEANPIQRSSDIMENPANGIKDAMWYFLMNGSHKFTDEDIDELTDSVYRLIQMTTQKHAGQKPYAKKMSIDWNTMDMELMRIVCYATTLVLSGRLDELRSTDEAN